MTHVPDERPADAGEPLMPDMPSDADPAALMQFMQRILGELQAGRDPSPLLAEAPPGFEQIMAAAQQQMEEGGMPDLGMFMGGEDGSDEDDEDAEEAEQKPTP